MSNRAPDYPERVIASLPKKWQRFMALCVLEGWQFKCGPLTQAGNRWWQVYTPSGKRMSGVGGLELEDVLRRLANSMEREKGRTYRDGNASTAGASQDRLRDLAAAGDGSALHDTAARG